MSNQLTWFRCHADIVDDEKLGLLAFEDRWHFIALLACKAKGLMDPEDEFARRKIQRKLGLTMDEFDKAIERLARMKLVDKETLEPINWDKRQFTSDKSTARVQAYRERMKRSRNVSETPPEYREQNTDISVTDDGETDSFDKFWEAYPRKVAKPDARKAWKQTAKDRPPIDALVSHLCDRVKSDPQWRDPKFIPHPATFLRSQRWDDALPSPGEAGTRLPRERGWV